MKSFSAEEDLQNQIAFTSDNFSESITYKLTLNVSLCFGQFEA